MKIDTARVRYDEPMLKRSEPRLDVLRIFAKKDADSSFGFLRLNHDLWNNFSVEVSVGRFDKRIALPASPGFACLELDGRDTDPLEFFGNCVQFNDIGAQAFAITRGNSNLGTLDLPGADVVDLRITSDGSRIWYLARPYGMGEFQAFASTPFSGKPYALQPSIGGNNLAGKTGFSFAYPRIDFNGRAPSRSDIKEEIVDLMYDADEDIWCACDALFFGDLELATEYLDEALDHIEEAESLTSGLPDDKTTRRLRRFLSKTGDQLDGGLRDLSRGRRATKIRKRATKGLGFMGKALRSFRGISVDF